MDTGTLRLEQTKQDGKAFLVVTGTTVTVRDLVIPEAWEGMPVCAIGAHAFAGNAEVRFVSLPESITSIGAFAFHNCKALQRMEVYDSVTDYGDGAIRQCTALSDVQFTVRQKSFEAVTRMLSDCDNTLTFSFSLPDGNARLTFPGFVYDFTENTMARTIQFNIEGSGMAFRECVSRAGIDFTAYDRLFSRAKLDNISVITQVVLNRLAYPYALSEQARAVYGSYLQENAGQILNVLVRQQDTGRIRFLVTQHQALLQKEALDEATTLASAKGLVEITALLTDCAASLQPSASHGRLSI